MAGQGETTAPLYPSRIKLHKSAFDFWWTVANAFRLESLSTEEIGALVEYHWRELVDEQWARDERDG
jgi:hypothetical protein